MPRFKLQDNEQQKMMNALQLYAQKQRMESQQQRAQFESRERAIWDRLEARNQMALQRDELNRQRNIQLDEQKNRMKEQSKNRQALNIYSSDANQALGALDKIEGEAKNLGDFQRGFIPQFMAKAKVGYKRFAKDQDLARYEGVVAQELIPMARKLMEEKGPITEFDVARVEKGFGDITLPLEDKLFLMDQLRAKVNQALKAKMELAGVQGDPKYQEIYGRSMPRQRGMDQEQDQGLNDIEARKERLRQRFLRRK